MPGIACKQGGGYGMSSVTGTLVTALAGRRARQATGKRPAPRPPALPAAVNAAIALARRQRPRRGPPAATGVGRQAPHGPAVACHALDLAGSPFIVI